MLDKERVERAKTFNLELEKLLEKL